MKTEEMIVTTSRRHEADLKNKALHFSEKLQTPFIIRHDRSIAEMVNTYNKDIFVVSKTKLSLHSRLGGEPFFYHPNSAMLRGKQFLRNKYDPFIHASQLEEGMTIVDGTLGLAADSLVAQLAVGEKGKVIGTEAHAGIACIVKEGLMTWDEGSPEIIQAMRAIEVVQSDHLTYLRSLSANSVDIVYFDPMFEHELTKSIGINPLKPFASDVDLSAEALEEAKRVGRKRIVLKDHWRSERFDRYQFTVLKRKNTVFHYGYIDLN